MIDFVSVSVRGVFNYARARVMWHDGLLRVFGKDGPLLEIVSDKPVKRSGYLLSWDVKTAKGEIVLRNKCITCGGPGWWRVVFMSPSELWSAQW